MANSGRLNVHRELAGMRGRGVGGCATTATVTMTASVSITHDASAASATAYAVRGLAGERDRGVNEARREYAPSRYIARDKRHERR